MDIYTVDFETYYAPDYSLTKSTTEEYVRDPRFEVIGVGIKKNDEPTLWYEADQARKFLTGNDFGNSFIVCHNTMFDGAILHWHYGVKPKLWVDTMSMARYMHGVHESASLAAIAKKYGAGDKGDEVIRALGKRRVDFSKAEIASYADYCLNDVDLTYDIFSKMMEAGFPKKELRVIDLTLRMFIEPTLCIDAGILTSRKNEIAQEKDRLLSGLMEEFEVETTEDVRAVLASNKKFAELLASRGVEVPMKTSLVTGKETYALAKKDPGFIALSESEDDFISTVCAVRLDTKSTIEEGRIDRFLNIATRNDFRLPVPLNYCGAHTGRWSGKDSVNLQNLPSRNPKKKALKNSITAPPGHLIIDCDSSQIEARILAWLAGQDDVVEAFANKQDVYRLMGAAIYNKAPEDITGPERFLSKTVVLGCGYGTGWKKLQFELNASGVKLPEDECKKIIHVYRKKNFRIVELWYEAETAIKRMISGGNYGFGSQDCLVFDNDGIYLPNGYKIRYPGLHFKRKGENVEYFYNGRKGATPIWYGTLVENVVQGLARCVISDQMLLISKRYRPVLTVHDAIAVVVPEEEKDEAVAFIEQTMKHVPKWAQGCPISCESGIGFSYGEC
jgi:DNA polymerase I-like protein with 3'-5' exonuclease and polymerase domains